MSKSPKFKNSPKYRAPAFETDPNCSDSQCIRFQFDLFDQEHAYWGSNRLTAEDWRSLVGYIRSFEKITWAEIKSAPKPGHSTKGSKHHSIEIDKFSKQAQHRICELKLDHVLDDCLFSLRLDRCVRLYGAREQHYFRILWFDPYHCDADKAAYPTKP